MKHLRSAAAAAAALALAVSLAGCGGAASSASSSSLLGPASNYDYQNFSYSQGLDDNGHWEGVTALDYVTLPDDYTAISLKKADVEPSEDDIQAQCPQHGHPDKQLGSHLLPFFTHTISS